MNIIRWRDNLTWHFQGNAAKSICGALSLALLFAGCAEVETPTLKETITRPLGAGTPFAQGASKEEVLSYWGKPDMIFSQGADELGNPKEEWVYKGRVAAIPLDYGYVSRTRRLFFVGDSLLRWEAEEAQPTTARQSEPSQGQ